MLSVRKKREDKTSRHIAFEEEEDGGLHVTISHFQSVEKSQLPSKLKRHLEKLACLIQENTDEGYQRFVETRVVGASTHGKIARQARYTVARIAGENNAERRANTNWTHDNTA